MPCHRSVHAWCCFPAANRCSGRKNIPSRGNVPGKRHRAPLAHQRGAAGTEAAADVARVFSRVIVSLDPTKKCCGRSWSSRRSRSRARRRAPAASRARTSPSLPAPHCIGGISASCRGSSITRGPWPSTASRSCRLMCSRSAFGREFPARSKRWRWMSTRTAEFAELVEETINSHLDVRGRFRHRIAREVTAPSRIRGARRPGPFSKGRVQRAVYVGGDRSRRSVRPCFFHQTVGSVRLEPLCRSSNATCRRSGRAW